MKAKTAEQTMTGADVVVRMLEVHVDYQQNEKLFEQVYEGSIL